MGHHGTVEKRRTTGFYPKGTITTKDKLENGTEMTLENTMHDIIGQGCQTHRGAFGRISR